jgi:branched-chain amino acid transport system permease protein
MLPNSKNEGKLNKKNIGCLALVIVLAALSVWGLVDNAKLFLLTLMNGLTLASLYFLVASGFTLVFTRRLCGLYRRRQNRLLAHGSTRRFC